MKSAHFFKHIFVPKRIIIFTLHITRINHSLNFANDKIECYISNMIKHSAMKIILIKFDNNY